MLYFLADKNVLNYADDTTPFAQADSWEQVSDELKEGTDVIFDWLTLWAFSGSFWTLLSIM